MLVALWDVAVRDREERQVGTNLFQLVLLNCVGVVAVFVSPIAAQTEI